MNLSNSIHRRGAFTLVELLVVIAIIGILVSLLLPAVQSAREAARRLQCSNNMKNLGLAAMNYHTAHQAFPPASVWRDDPSGSPDAGAIIDQQNNARFSETWVVLLMPYLEQQNLYDSYLPQFWMNAPENRDFRGVELAVMKCPSDSYNRTKYAGVAGSAHNSNHGDNWARGNYAANGALGFQSDNAHCSDYGVPAGSGCAAFNGTGWNTKEIRGVMGANASSTIDEIRDGTSNTIMLLEIRAGVSGNDCRGVWAMSGAGPSACWAHGYIGDAGGPNAGAIASDDIAGCAEIQAAVGGDAELRALGMGCYGGTSSAPNRQASPRSMHVGGIFCTFADGSVHWITDYIEVSSTVTYASAWDKLNLSMDGEVLSAEEW